MCVVAHNNKQFDLHLYLLDLIKMSDHVTVIAENLEKFKFITTENFIFLDSFQFLSSSLDNLVKSLRTTGKLHKIAVKLRYIAISVSPSNKIHEFMQL